MNETIKDYIIGLNNIFETHNICHSHGTEHAISVMNNAIRALEHVDISENDKRLVCIASLLHDADDYKFFPDNKIGYQNLKTIMKSCHECQEDIDKVIRMVDLVSASKNGDHVPNVPEWYLIPRYADRLEAIGMIGIKRCYEYNKTIGSKIYDENTPIFFSKKDILEYIHNNKQRYNSYNGISNSMIDHYYDKLLHITEFPIRNKYFDEQCEILRDVQIDFLLYFGSCMKNHNEFSDAHIQKFIDE